MGHGGKGLSILVTIGIPNYSWTAIESCTERIRRLIVENNK